MSLRKIARNPHSDDVFKLFKGFTHRVTSDHWSVYALQSSYASLLRGEKENGLLTTYSLLKPSIFEQFGSTIIASACFEDTMLYRLWMAQGVEMEPVGPALTGSLRYQQHENGDQIVIVYVSDEDWSKSLRDRKITVDDDVVSVMDRLVNLIGEATDGEPFAWMGNKDLDDDLFAHLPGAERLPNSPHGMNNYQHLHRVVVLSALNPPPAHFAFMSSQTITSEELRTSHYRTAVYQAVMRISIRNPACDEAKLVVVMDRSTADWLAALFPGAKVIAHDGLGVRLQKGKPGRRRRHETNAERKRAYRVEQQMKWSADLQAINGTGLEPLTYGAFLGEVRAGASTDLRDKNTSNKDILSLGFGSAFVDKFASRPEIYLDLDDEEQFIGLLDDLHQEVAAAKEHNVLLSPSHFDPDMAGTATCRGLANITHVRGIWMDNDGGDLTHKEFARLFPYLRIVIWNTYSSTRANPRWRAFIPTNYAMSVEVHHCIMRQIEQVLNNAGYASDAVIAKSTSKQTVRKKPWLRHGFDTGKFNAASLFYAPCKAADPEGSFFVDYDDEERAALDLRMWLERCILDVTPEPEPVAPATTAPPPAPTQPIRDPKLKAIADKLAAMKASDTSRYRQDKIDAALEAWRYAPKGTGNAAFFTLGTSLKRAGLADSDIQQRLREQAIHANSPSDRRKEIRDIMRSLAKMGRF